MAEKETKEVAKKPVDTEAFIARKLRAVNQMKNKALAKTLGERVLKNR